MSSFSAAGPAPEIQQPRRIILLETLKSRFSYNVPSTAWACLWLSDLDILERLVAKAKVDPLGLFTNFRYLEGDAKIVQKCQFPFIFKKIEFSNVI